MTNGDKIRQMTDEELIEYLSCVGAHDGESAKKCITKMCSECKKTWLKQEAEE